MFENIIILSKDDRSFLTHRLPMARAAQSVSKSVTVICQNTGKIRDLECAGFEVIDLPAGKRFFNIFTNISVILRLANIYKKARPDIVYHSSVQMSFIGAMASLLIGNVLHINSITGVGYLFSSDNLKARLLRCALTPVMRFLWARNNAVMLFQNPDDRSLFCAKGLAETDAPLIRGSGVDVVKFSPVRISKTPKSDDKDRTAGKNKAVGKKIIIGCASRLLKDKGLEELISAIRLLEGSLALELRIAGEIYQYNPSSFSLSDIQSWSGIKSVSMLGNVKDMAKFWRGCDIAILPSHREGLPKALLEAAACGLPLLGADVAGIREIILHGSNGLLFAKGDDADIASKITEIASDQTFRKAAGKASRRLVETGGYSDADVQASFVDLFRSMQTRAAFANDR
ncbi:glycosyltransferase family 4 protein [Alphaproteobacteria bacterium]|nr:glycosyltransferase family 4 protein [Alphaproteobacteria bacterium]